MDDILREINRIADIIFGSIIMPVFSAFSTILCMVITDPMTRAGIPVALQITTVAAVISAVSIILRQLTGMERHEKAFHQEFRTHISCQKDMAKLSDWKIKKLMFEASDNELDETFNEYIAAKYVRYTTVYLLPIILGEIWLNHVFDDSRLIEINGAAWVLPLPYNSFGLEGLSVSAMFLIAYLFFLFLFFFTRRIINKKKKIQKFHSKNHI